MGAILDLPAEAAPYGAEARSESFYLNSPNRFRPIDGGVAVRADDLPAVLAALDAVTDWGTHVWVAGPLPVSPDASVTARREGDLITVLGGDWLHVYSADLEATGCIEITYSHLGALRDALAAV